MFEEEYRKEMEAVGPDREQMERLLAAMEQKGCRPRPLRRTILLVAAACAAMVMKAQSPKHKHCGNGHNWLWNHTHSSLISCIKIMSILIFIYSSYIMYSTLHFGTNI